MAPRKPSKKKSKTIHVTVANVTIKIHPIKNRGRTIYTVAHLDHDGRRVRRNFSTIDKAKAAAQATATKIHTGKSKILELSGEDLGIYHASLEAIKPTGRPLHLAAKEYASAFKILDSKASLVEAAEYFARQHTAKIIKMKVPDLVEEFIRNKKADGKSQRYLEDCRSRLRIFAKEFTGDIGTITAQELDDWIRKMKVAGRTRNNFRRMIITLFRHARKHSMLPKNEPTAADGLDKVKDASSPIGIFKPEQMARLFEAASENLVPYLAIGAFAGLRHAEILRLEWCDINFDQGHIEVKADKAKTAQRRIVPMSHNLKIWLAPFRIHQGLVCYTSRTGPKSSALAKKIKIGWPNNVLRHSFGSYRLAQCKNAAEVALEMGNSPRMIFQHYREVVTEADAKNWFDIKPADSKGSKVVEMSAA